MIPEEDRGSHRLRWVLAAICLLIFSGALVTLVLVARNDPQAPLLSARVMTLTFGLPCLVSLAVASLYVYRAGHRCA